MTQHALKKKKRSVVDSNNDDQERKRERERERERDNLIAWE